MDNIWRINNVLQTYALCSWQNYDHVSITLRHRDIWHSGLFININSHVNYVLVIISYWRFLISNFMDQVFCYSILFIWGIPRALCFFLNLIHTHKHRSRNKWNIREDSPQFHSQHLPSIICLVFLRSVKVLHGFAYFLNSRLVHKLHKNTLTAFGLTWLIHCCIFECKWLQCYQNIERLPINLITDS